MQSLDSNSKVYNLFLELGFTRDYYPIFCLYLYISYSVYSILASLAYFQDKRKDN